LLSARRAVFADKTRAQGVTTGTNVTSSFFLVGREHEKRGQKPPAKDECNLKYVTNIKE